MMHPAKVLVTPKGSGRRVASAKSYFNDAGGVVRSGGNPFVFDGTGWKEPKEREEVSSWRGIATPKRCWYTESAVPCRSVMGALH
jgi:hypothetical protein